MRILLCVFAFIYTLTACDAKMAVVKDSQKNKSTLNNVNKSFKDGWPAGIPKDTIPDVPLKSYSGKIKAAILKSAAKRNNSESDEIHLLEVYRCRAWDGEKWFTTQNEYSVLVCDKKSGADSQWVIPVECRNGNYITGEWIEKK